MAECEMISFGISFVLSWQHHPPDISPQGGWGSSHACVSRGVVVEPLAGGQACGDASNVVNCSNACVDCEVSPWSVRAPVRAWGDMAMPRTAYSKGSKGD